MNDIDQSAREIQYINLKLAARGQATYRGVSGDLLEVAWPLLQNHQEKSRLLAGHLCPADRRIQDFLDAYFGATPAVASVSIPNLTFTLPAGIGSATFPAAGQGSLFLRNCHHLPGQAGHSP